MINGLLGECPKVLNGIGDGLLERKPNGLRGITESFKEVNERAAISTFEKNSGDCV